MASSRGYKRRCRAHINAIEICCNHVIYSVVNCICHLPSPFTITMSSDSLDEKRSLLSKLGRPRQKHVLVIHGGAGTILREKSSPEQQARYHAGLRAALLAGNAVLSSGGEAMDAVVAAVSVMEGKPCQPHRKRPRPVLDVPYLQTTQFSTLARVPYSTRAASCVFFISHESATYAKQYCLRPRRMNSKRRWRSPALPRHTPTSCPRAAPSH